MKKVAAMLLCFCLVSIGSVAAFAQTVSPDGAGGAAISVTVPDSHTVTVSAQHAQVFFGGQWGESFSVERLSEPRLLIRPEDGYKVTKVTLNGEDVTSQVQGGYYTLEPVYEEKELVVETKEIPGNPDSTHDISGTVTDEDGNPIPGATVDIGGQTGVTDEDGNFTIEDVPDGYHPITITDEEGNLIGHTEVEIGEGEPGVTPNPDGSYTLTSPEDAGLGLGLTVTEDGKISVDSLADITPGQPSEPSKPSNPSEPSGDNEGSHTGDNSQIGLWLILMLISAGALAILLINRRKKAANEQ